MLLLLVCRPVGMPPACSPLHPLPLPVQVFEPVEGLAAVSMVRVKLECLTKVPLRHVVVGQVHIRHATQCQGLQVARVGLDNAASDANGLAAAKQSSAV